MKRAFSHMLRWLVAHRLSWLASFMVSLAVSVLDGRPTRARWDGEDWEFRWSDGCLYSLSHQIRPKFVTQQNIGMYLREYQPQEGDVILEVGAGAGTEVCTLSEMVGATGRIIAIEADPTAIRLLRKQARLLEYSNVAIIETAVGSQEGTIELSMEAPGGVSNSTATTIGGETIAVRCQRLDDLIEKLGIKTVSFMKMNIEGAEYDALVGMGSAIRKTEKIFVSCHDFTGTRDQKTFDKVYEYLQSLGMSLTTLPPNPGKPWEQYYIYGRWVIEGRVADTTPGGAPVTGIGP